MCAASIAGRRCGQAVNVSDYSCTACYQSGFCGPCGAAEKRHILRTTAQVAARRQLAARRLCSMSTHGICGVLQWLRGIAPRTYCGIWRVLRQAGNFLCSSTMPNWPVHHVQALAAVYLSSKRAFRRPFMARIPSLAANTLAEAALAASACRFSQSVIVPSMSVCLDDMPDEILTDILALAMKAAAPDLELSMTLRLWCDMACVCHRWACLQMHLQLLCPGRPASHRAPGVRQCLAKALGIHDDRCLIEQVA